MQVGDTVYLRPVGNSLRRGYVRTDIVEGYEIKKIGRKYLEVWKNGLEYTTEKFYIETLRQVTNYSEEWELYLSKQDIEEENEFNTLRRAISSKFTSYGELGLTLDQLRRISEIIKE